MSEILNEAGAKSDTPLGAVLRHPIVMREAKTCPFVGQIESLTYELDSSSTRTHVFHFFEIRLAEGSGKNTSRVLYFQFEEDRWPIRVSERFYLALPKTVREQ